MIIYNSLLINHGGGDIIMRLYTSYTRMRVCIYRVFLYINIPSNFSLFQFFHFQFILNDGFILRIR
jgi:hypothetical protein